MALKTPMYNAHLDLHATIVDFGGWDMPVYYTNVIDEHSTTREKVALFDTSHMGEFEFKGKDALKLLQHVVARDLSKEVVGQMMLSVLCTEKGGIVDDCTVYKFSDEHYFMVVNAGTMPGDWKWIENAKNDLKLKDVQMKNISNETAKLDLQGPKAEEILQSMVDYDLKKIKYYYFAEMKVAGIPSIVSRSGYTGEDGFEIYFPWEKGVELWNKIMQEGAKFGIKAAGLGARDTLRLEAGYMLYGNDIDLEHSPLEAVYGWAVSLDKENFIGKAALVKQKEQGMKRKLRGFEMVERGIARHGYKVFKGGKEIGIVTSGSLATTLKKNIGMAYVSIENAEIGNEIEIQIRDKLYKAKIVKMPFYKRDVSN